MSEWLDTSGFQPTSRPELSSPAAKEKYKEKMGSVVGVPQILRLKDGRLVDSFDYLSALGVEIILDYEPTAPGTHRYMCQLPSDVNMSQGEVHKGFGEEGDPWFQCYGTYAEFGGRQPYMEVMGSAGLKDGKTLESLYS